MPAFVNASNVRAYAGIDGEGDDGRWSESNLSSNIRTASSFLQKRTHRQFELQVATTKKFTTNGLAFVPLPGARGNSPIIRLAGTTMELDTNAWLIPDTLQSGVYIGIQFRPFGRGADYRSFPDWFDTNKDRRWHPGFTSDPNDLLVTDDWGYPPDEYPEELLLATKAMTAWITRRPDALLGGVTVTAGGTEIDLSQAPEEVRMFLLDWTISAEPSVVSTG